MFVSIKFHNTPNTSGTTNFCDVQETMKLHKIQLFELFNLFFSVKPNASKSYKTCKAKYFNGFQTLHSYNAIWHPSKRGKCKFPHKVIILNFKTV